MSLLQISDPTITNENLKKFVVGIDLGTTNSLIASYDSNLKIYQENSSNLIPSVVGIQKNDNILVGNNACLQSDSETTIIRSIKRIMGLSYEDINKLEHQESFPVVRAQNDLPCIAVNDKEYSAIDISSKILSHLKQLAESMENKTLDGAVITVPAYFNDIQRQATKNAAKMSGINVLRLLNEPTAAALAYGLESNETGSFVIYDFGGGTFDVSVLNLDKGIFKVLSTDGNTRLGGDDIDNAISIWLSNNYSFMQKYSHTEIKEYAKSIKESIANEESISIKVNENSVTLSQDQFQDIIAPILNETFEIVKNAITASGLSSSEIKNIILVGGSTRINCIKNLLEKKFSCSILKSRIDNTVK